MLNAQQVLSWEIPIILVRPSQIESFDRFSAIKPNRGEVKKKDFSIILEIISWKARKWQRKHREMLLKDLQSV